MQSSKSRSNAHALCSIVLVCACVLLLLVDLDKGQTRRPVELKAQPEIDRRNSEAEQLFAEAEALRAKWVEASLRQAIEKFDKAALIWNEIGIFPSASHATLKSGDIYFLLSDYPEALKRYEEAAALAEKAGDRLAEAKARS